MNIGKRTPNSVVRIKAHHYPVKLMGCGFVITAVDANPQKAWDGIRAGVKEIERIEALISSWKNDSETTMINNSAGRSPVKISQELFDLIERSMKVSELTTGTFDISGTLSRDYWKFDKQENTWLPEDKIAELRELIDYRHIKLDYTDRSAFLEKEQMKIGFGGIGKGYAAYRAMVIMKELGVRSGLINASGDLVCWGAPPGHSTWEINITHPLNPTHRLVQFNIPEGSVVTSGNSENYTLIDGKRFSHIVDPRTGRPVEFIKNVTVVCPNPEFADAIATAITVLGANHGINLVNRLNGVECMVIDSQDNIYFSNHLKSFEL